jgi:3-oxoacyl-(acyl-carrier-protein) synthase
MNNGSCRVFVTGRSLLVGGVTTVENLWREVLEERRLVEVVEEEQFLRTLSGIEPSDAAVLARHQLLALAVVERAWTDSNLPSTRNRLRGETSKVRNSRYGFVGGTSIGGLAAMESEIGPLAANPRVSPYAMTRWRGNSLGVVTSLRYGLGSVDFSLNAASATGSQAIYLAGTLIRSGIADLVVVATADPSPTPMIYQSMVRSGSVTKDTSHGPLASGRSGMNPVEGAACIILESEDHAKSRGVNPIAEWCGGECANEAHHLFAPMIGAVVLRKLLEQSIENHVPQIAGVRTVDWISLHATGTKRFDAIEISALKDYFGTGKMPWLSALKRVYGHALSASGIIEAILVTEGLQRGEVPPWPSGVDPSLGLGESGEGRAPHPKVALQIGQGMGGLVVVNVFAQVSRCRR